MDKTSEQTSQSIHEARRLCWHDWKKIGEGQFGLIEITCTKCKIKVFGDIKIKNNIIEIDAGCHSNPNYLEHGKPWTKMLNWARNEEWWNKLLYNYIEPCSDYGNMPIIDIAVYEAEGLIDLFAEPAALATEIVKYLEESDERT